MDSSIGSANSGQCSQSNVIGEVVQILKDLSQHETEIGNFSVIETADKEAMVGTEVEKAVALCAYEVFNDYARSLDRRNNPDVVHFKSASHIHSLGAVGIVALDTRAQLSFDKIDNDNPFGKRQWGAFKRAIEGPTFENTSLLVVCFQDPLDKSDFWELTPAIAKARRSLIKYLNTWRDGQPLCSREVVVICPDTESRITDIIDTGFETNLGRKLGLDDDLCGLGNHTDCPVKFLPRNRLRQISIGPLSGIGPLKLNLLGKQNIRYGNSRNNLAFIQYP